MKEDIQAHDNVLSLIGNTPLIRLNKITQSLTGNFYAKVEAFNPGHSTKDRIALYIIEEAEKQGILTPGDTIIETTSGNTGFSTGPHLHLTIYASQGVKVGQYGSYKPGGSGCAATAATGPFADLNAYLDPMSYLPSL